MDLQTITDNQYKALQKFGFDFVISNSNLPALELVAKWLRDEKNIYIVILPTVNDIWHSDFHKADFFEYRIVYKGISAYSGTGNSYEDALSNAIDTVLSNAIDADMNII